MCVVSAMGDHYKKNFEDQDLAKRLNDYQQIISGTISVPNPVTRQEFEELKKQVLEMKEILKVAAAYDARNNEPHCEMDEKVELLKKVAAAVGVSLDDIFKTQQ